MTTVEDLRRQTVAVVIWYHPSDSNVQNIATYLDFVDRVYILDNSESNNEELLAKCSFGDKVTYVTNGKNEGIGRQLNIAMKMIGDSYTYALLLDQDSHFSEFVLRKFYTKIVENTERNVIIYAPSYIATEAARPQSYGLVDRCITSGSILNLAYARKLDGFHEGLFIDEVDFEFCLRAKKQGYQIVQFYDGVLMEHELGSAVDVGGVAHFREHSPVRTYYIVRNRLYMAKWFPAYKWHYYGSIVKKLIKIAIVETQKKEKWHAVRKAFVDYRKGILGATAQIISK